MPRSGTACLPGRHPKAEPPRFFRVHYTMLSSRSVPFVQAGLGLLLGAGSLSAQARIIDEGTFIITRTGAPSETESFRIRVDNGTVMATGQLNAGTKRVNSAMTTDSLGTPMDYRVDVRENGKECR